MKNTLGLIILLVCSAALHAVEYRLPFSGRWFVAQGGDTPNVNQHMRAQAQWYGFDFMKTGGKSGRELTKGAATSLDAFFSWEEPVLSPVDEEVIDAVATFPDNPIGSKDTKNPEGNQVVIKAAADRFVFLAHMQKGSVRVKIGDRVK